MKMDLRNRKIIVELEGEKKEYSSIKEFCNEKEFSYTTVLGWLRKKTKPSINIKIEYKDNV